MKEIEELIQQVAKVKDGFKPIQLTAEQVLAHHSSVDNLDSLRIAQALYTSDVYQARMLATIIFGKLAFQFPETFAFLKHTVSKDENWRVQEMLAMTFDTYCKVVGYEQALPTIQAWLQDANPNVKRAVTEGLRIWTHREYFKQHPTVAIQLLSQLKNDESDYVRKSVGNALRDISRFHKDLVKAELASWNTSEKKVAYTYKLASKFLYC